MIAWLECVSEFLIGSGNLWGQLFGLKNVHALPGCKSWLDFIFYHHNGAKPDCVNKSLGQHQIHIHNSFRVPANLFKCVAIWPLWLKCTLTSHRYLFSQSKFAQTFDKCECLCEIASFSQLKLLKHSTSNSYRAYRSNACNLHYCHLLFDLHLLTHFMTCTKFHLFFVRAADSDEWALLTQTTSVHLEWARDSIARARGRAMSKITFLLTVVIEVRIIFRFRHLE